MCKFASFVVGKNYEVFWFAGVDSHSVIIRQSKINDNDDLTNRNFAKIEILPPDGDKKAPLDQWKFKIDEATEPSWFDQQHRAACWSALKQKMNAETGEYCVTDRYGTKHWYRNGLRHREDGPASVSPNGTQRWYKNGVLHRDDGPAAILADGSEFWYKNGLQHRDDGPAVVWEDGSQWWYQNGELHRDNGPAVVYPDGKQYWWKNGKPVSAPVF